MIFIFFLIYIIAHYNINGHYIHIFEIIVWIDYDDSGP